eukprot:Selendium_serpulae@DN2269_c0_g1_i2.p1
MALKSPVWFFPFLAVALLLSAVSLIIVYKEVERIGGGVSTDARGGTRSRIARFWPESDDRRGFCKVATADDMLQYVPRLRFDSGGTFLGSPGTGALSILEERFELDLDVLATLCLPFENFAAVNWSISWWLLPLPRLSSDNHLFTSVMSI